MSVLLALLLPPASAADVRLELLPPLEVIELQEFEYQEIAPIEIEAFELQEFEYQEIAPIEPPPLIKPYIPEPYVPPEIPELIELPTLPAICGNGGNSTASDLSAVLRSRPPAR